MRFELDFLERAYIANMYRAKATRLRDLAEKRTGSATQRELFDEAASCELKAQKLDDAIEPAVVSDKEPSRVDNTKGAPDLNYMDEQTRRGWSQATPIGGLPDEVKS